MRKRILHIITKLELGGAQKSTLYLVRELAGLPGEGTEIFLFTSEGTLKPESLGIKNITNLHIIYSDSLNRRISLFKDIRAFFEIVRLIKEKNIDIVHTHSSKAGILGRLAAVYCGVKQIFHTVHGFSFNEFIPIHRRLLYKACEYILAAKTNKFVFVCESDIQKAKKYKLLRKASYILIRENFTPLDRQNVLSNGVNPLELCKGINLKNEHKRICMISCLKPQKSPLDYVRAAKIVTDRHDNVCFDLVGDGVLRKKIEALSKTYALENKLILHGWHLNPMRVLAEADIFVLCSKWEGLPIVLYEAMSLAKPIVAANVDGVREVVTNAENGFLVEPGDFQTLAARILYLLNHPRLCREMGRKSYEKLSKFSGLDEMVRKIVKAYGQEATSKRQEVRSERQEVRSKK